MQIRFFLAGKNNWEQSGSVVGRGSHPLPGLGDAQKGQGGWEQQSFWVERPDLGFQGGFLTPLGQDCPRTAKLLCFSLDKP